MIKKFKFRGWVLIILGIILAYLIQPILIQLSLNLPNSISRSNLTYVAVVIGIGGDISICFGLILNILRWIMSKLSKNKK